MYEICYFLPLYLSVVTSSINAEAAYRFFKTKSEEDSLKRSGKSEIKKVTRRRQERITRVSKLRLISRVSLLFCRRKENEKEQS